MSHEHQKKGNPMANIGPTKTPSEVVEALDRQATDLARKSMDTALDIAPVVGSQESRSVVADLIESARAGYVRHIPGLPLMIDGVDCSPENVRRLMKSLEAWKLMVAGGETDR